MFSATLQTLTHGWNGLLLAYGSVHAPMLAGMMRGRAPAGKYLLSPVGVPPLMLASAIGVSAVTPVLNAMGVSAGGWLHLSFGLGVSAAVGYGAGRLIASRARSAQEDIGYRRGTVISDGPTARASQSTAMERGRERLNVAGARTAARSSVTLATVPVAPEDETKHFKLIGTTGTGKSTAIRELLGAALRRGDRAVIADPDGGYLQRFYDPKRGDVILNPFDTRSVKWDLFGEIQNPYDVDQLARALIPDQGGQDRSWRGYARTFFTAVTRQTHEAGETDVAELYRLLLMADRSELKELVRGTPAQPFLEEHNGRMFDSIRSVTGSAVEALEYVAEQEATPFSVRKWIQAPAPTSGGVLFIPYQAGQIAALRSTISAWMRLAIFETMGQERDDQRLWFVVDELDALGQIDGLKDALARLRKFGGRCVLGFQSIAQVSSTYGSGEAQTIVENCGNTLILRCSGSERGGTSQFASRLIGQREVLRSTVSRSRRPTELLSSITRSEHYAIESAVMDSEIEQLPDLTGYLKLASTPDWIRVTLPVASAEKVDATTSAIRSAAERLWTTWRAGRRQASHQSGRDSVGNESGRMDSTLDGRDFD